MIVRIALEDHVLVSHIFDELERATADRMFVDYAVLNLTNGVLSPYVEWNNRKHEVIHVHIRDFQIDLHCG